jgi:hypothetical protein
LIFSIGEFFITVLETKSLKKIKYIIYQNNKFVSEVLELSHTNVICMAFLFLLIQVGEGFNCANFISKNHQMQNSKLSKFSIDLCGNTLYNKNMYRHMNIRTYQKYEMVFN